MQQRAAQQLKGKTLAEEAKAKADLELAKQAEEIAKEEVRRARKARADAELRQEQETHNAVLAAARGGSRSKKDEESAKIKIKIAKQDIEQVGPTVRLMNTNMRTRSRARASLFTHVLGEGRCGRGVAHGEGDREL